MSPHEREALRLIARQERLVSRIRRFDWLAWTEAKHSLERSVRLGAIARRMHELLCRTQERMVALALKAA